MDFHDLTSRLKPQKNIRSHLGLSLKFIPNTRLNTPWTDYLSKTFLRLERDHNIKVHIAGKPIDPMFNPKLYIKSTCQPPYRNIPTEVHEQLRSFRNSIKPLVHKKNDCNNILPHQRLSMNALRNQVDLLVVQCDKNLGPTIIERKYIKMTIRYHLRDVTTYRHITQAHADIYEFTLKHIINSWI
jgi:hypothetical protein